MSLVTLACNCASAEPLLRKSLASWGHPNPFAVRMYKGDEAKAWVNKNQLNDLILYLGKHNSYAIVCGWGENKQVHWSDINLPSVDGKIKAKLIVETFA